MAKIAFIGAGSTVFTRNLLRDLFLFPELRGTEIALMDIDPERLRDSEIVAHKAAQAAGARPAISATTDRGRALDGADYVINMIQVGGYEPATVTDFALPKKYGLRQTIGDTLGIGGIFRALRTIPVMLDIALDIELHCPDALLLNYTNPMAMICWAMSRGTRTRTVGLCHSVQHTAEHLARIAGVPAAELDYRCAGINHMAFFLELRHQGRDLYPALRAALRAGQVPGNDRVRADLFLRLGYYVTESSEHFSEYVPWFIKRDRPDLLERYRIPLDEYPRRCEAQIADWAAMRAVLEAPDPHALEGYERSRHGAWLTRAADDPHYGPLLQAEWEAEQRDPRPRHSGEYGTLIIHSIETGQPRVVYGNVPNHGLIDNLPAGCSVEVPCLVDRNGVQPTVVGALPPQLAALMQTNVNVQALTVEAALSGKREHIYHAAMLDPHTAAELDLDQIWALVDDLLDAHQAYLPRLVPATAGAVTV
jgi:alpha-galactosidase